MPSFREIKFKSGFNVVLAERTERSTIKDSRNGLGKSTLIEIIHFCLGAGVGAKKGLLVGPLSSWTFTIDLTLANEFVSVSRNTANPKQVFIEGKTSNWPIQPENNIFNERSLSVKDWNSILGYLMFDQPINISEKPYSPTPRSLISYFIRRGRDSFSTPFEHFRKQAECDKQVNNAFLLNLDWEDASEVQSLKDKKKLLENLKIASRSGIVSEVLGSIGKLEAEKVQLEEKARYERENLKSFKVHPQYQQYEEDANKLTAEIHQAANANFSDKRLLNYYTASLEDESEPEIKDLNLLYQEAGVILPNSVLRRLEDVQNFHSTLLANRRQFLKEEVERINRRIISRDELIAIKTGQRAEILQTLQTYGALEEYSRLQQTYLETSAKVNDLNSKIARLRQINAGTSNLKIEQELLLQRMRRNYEERKTQRELAISIFNAYSQVLYKAPGRLVIDVGSNGFKFNVEIERSGSSGIENMKVFCYDLMLANLWSKKESSPKFLIHDSTIFDGVDERQIALALELAASESQINNFQYICTFNSDMIPWNEFSSGFDFNSFIRVRLDDGSPEGSLLGIRY